MPSNPFCDLRGVRTLITGAARGLGLGIARSLADWGAHVAILDRDAADVEAACRGFGEGQNVTGVIADVTDEAAVERAIEQAVAGLGGLDLAVNNAGVLSVRPVLDMELAEWRRILEVNATGTFLVSRTAARAMVAGGGGGSIVSIASIAGKQGDPLLAHYSASKFAVVGFTQALAQELGGLGITVNAICPGVVETQMIQDFSAGSARPVQQMVEAQAIKRPQTPREIAMAVAFLHANRAVTGQAINVDGGSLFH